MVNVIEICSPYTSGSSEVVSRVVVWTAMGSIEEMLRFGAGEIDDDGVVHVAIVINNTTAANDGMMVQASY